MKANFNQSNRMKRFYWRQWSFAIRLTVILTMTVTLTVMSITVISVQYQQQAFRTEMEQQASLLLDALSASAIDYLYFLDLAALSDIMETLGQDQHILMSGRFYDNEGRVIADAFNESQPIPSQPDPFGEQLLNNDGTVYEWQADQLVAGRAVKAGRQSLGAISVGLPTAALQDKVTAVRNRGFLGALTTAVIGAFITILFIHRSFNAPLRELMQATERIASGDLAQPITLKRQDEVGRLAVTLDNMRVELLGLYEGLEQQVEERTTELQNSDSLYRLVVSSISDAIYRAQLEDNGRFQYTYLSPNIPKLTGYSLDNFQDDPLFWLPHIHPEDRPLFREQLKQFTAGKSSDREFRFVHGERGVIWLRNSGRVLHDETNQSLTIYGVISDVTEHKETEQALAKQIRLFENLVVVAQATTGHPSMEQTLQSILNVTIMLTDAEEGGRSSLFVFNQAGLIASSVLARGKHTFKRIEQFVAAVMVKGLAGWVANYHQTALIFDTSEDDRWLGSPEDEETARSALAVPIMSGTALLAVLTLAHPDIGHFTMDHAYLLEAATGQLSLALRNAQMHDEQMQQAERQRTLYETLKAVGSHLDPNNVAQVAATAVADLTQWPAVEILLPHLQDKDLLVVKAATGPAAADIGDQVPITTGIIGRAARSKQTQYAPDVSADSDYIPSHIATAQSELVVPLTHSGRLLGILNLVDDALDAFDQEDILLAESLAEAIALALDNARLHRELLQAKESAENANRAKTEFISVVSHELKTPMTSIRGYTDLILGGLVGSLTEKQTEFLNTVNDNVTRMQTLVSDLTDISRIESGQFYLAPKAVMVDEVVNEVIRTMQGQFANKQHQVEVDVMADLPPVWVDRNRLIQIMNNLLSNACKYTPPEGQIKVEINLNHDSALPDGVHQKSVHIAVADTGIGISETDQAKLFEKFFRARDDTAQMEAGTGLGLNITKNLVELQNGRIWLESEFRKGTTFHITLPIFEAPTESDRLP